MRRVILDTSVVVGAIDQRDVHRSRATALIHALHEAARLGLAALVFLDCVAVETIGVLCRRRAERSSPAPLPDFRITLPAERITRAYPLLAEAWDEILDMVRASDGRLNAHDALILAYARRHGISFIATFDTDLAEQGVPCLRDAAEAADALGVSAGAGR